MMDKKTSGNSSNTTEAVTTTPFDLVIVGLGNASADMIMTRHNAGYIFCDYLANCLSIQRHLIEEQEKNGDQVISVDAPVIPANFKRPVFKRRLDIGVDVHEAVFNVTTEDLVTYEATTEIGKLKAAKGKGTQHLEARAYRILLVKPLSGVNYSGDNLSRLLKALKLDDPKFIESKLLVVFDDMNTLPGSIAIQGGGGDLAAVQGHKGVESIVTALGTKNFIRLRLGIGRPSAGDGAENYVLSAFQTAQKEMDLFAYCLDLSAQALQHYCIFGDIKATKKKFGTSKKLPKTLQAMQGLVFPVETVDV